MRWALYLGCTVPVRAMNYELAARRTAERLGIEFVDIEGFACCGYPVKPLDWESSVLMAASNLSLVEEQGLDLCTLCNACTSTLLEANHHLRQDRVLRDRVNQQLEASTGRRYEGTVVVRHYARLLYEEIGLERLRAEVTEAAESCRVDLSAFGFAPHYGCHYLRPPDLHDGFDDPEAPHTLDELIKVTGAQSVSYEETGLCCGGGILAIDQETALAIAKRKLDQIQAAQADGMVLVCPFCDIMYEINQRSIERRHDVTYRLPVLYYPQLLGLALGLSAEEVGLRLNRVKARSIMRQMSGHG
jgi:heterodisulfide reductase subunit B